MENIIIFALFALACAYLGKIFYNSFFKKESICKGCGSCKIDFQKIEQQIQKDGKSYR